MTNYDDLRYNKKIKQTYTIRVLSGQFYTLYFNMSRKKVTIFESFDAVWERIKEESNLDTLKKLAELLETSTQNVSNKKREKYFPIEWGYTIARKYNLLAEWVMEGTGPKRLNENRIKAQESNNQNTIGKYIDEWLAEQAIQDERIANWFEFDFEKKYPEFGEWKRKKLEEERKNTIPRQQNIA